MSKVRTLLLVLTVIAAGFLIFTATHYADLLHVLARGPISQVCSGINVGTFNGLCTGPGVAPTIPWVVLGWLIFLSIVFVDLVIADIYLFFKRKRPEPQPKAEVAHEAHG